jgi:hypothetical protein
MINKDVVYKACGLTFYAIVSILSIIVSGYIERVLPKSATAFTVYSITIFVIGAVTGILMYRLFNNE